MAIKRALGLTGRLNALTLSSPAIVPQVQTNFRVAAMGVRHVAKLRRQEQLERSEEARSLEKMFTRNWQVGDVYAPHDLSAAEARKFRRVKAPNRDVFDVLNVNPLDMYKNFSVMSEFITNTGRIKPRSMTGLRRVNQRRVAKAIKRAVAMGLMPSVYRHPEILRNKMEADAELRDIMY